MPAKKLTDAEISSLLPRAKGWSVVNGKLHREFRCKDFVTAFGNMTRVALVAEAMSHHPEWFNVWNKVVIDLNTHSVKGISDYDFTLAEKINEIEDDLAIMSADCQPQKSSRSWIFLVARWAAALMILGILFYLLPVTPLRNALSRVPLTRFIAVLLIYLVALTGGITKWHTVVNSAGAQLSFAASAQCYTSGLFGALFLPSIIGGDVARLAVGISRSPGPAAVITGNVADRFLDVAAQLTLISMGLMLLPGSLPVPLQVPAKHVLLSGIVGAAVLFGFAVALCATSPCDPCGLAPTTAAASWLVAGNIRAGHLCSAHCSPGFYLWPGCAAACVALRVATCQNRRSHADHARWHRGSRGGPGGFACAVWCAGIAGSCNRHRLGRRDHHRRSSCGTDRVSLAPLAVSSEPPLALL
ncbi:MAG: 4a-hydroxytetrahydrobiopterin dehydratase [Acidobacteria bacterium]|nr:MAG: 4a-hydroxytetrahydrobiopterin dehydratase [Acidobacteriota bacterium]